MRHNKVLCLALPDHAHDAFIIGGRQVGTILEAALVEIKGVVEVERSQDAARTQSAQDALWTGSATVQHLKVHLGHIQSDNHRRTCNQ